MGVEDVSMAKWQHNCARTQIAKLMVYFWRHTLFPLNPSTCCSCWYNFISVENPFEDLLVLSGRCQAGDSFSLDVALNVKLCMPAGDNRKSLRNRNPWRLTKCLEVLEGTCGSEMPQAEKGLGVREWLEDGLYILSLLFLFRHSRWLHHMKLTWN